MSNFDIIRAWKDEEFRNSLSEEQRLMLPENPAGLIELSDEEMQSLAGGDSYTCNVNCGNAPQTCGCPPGLEIGAF